MKNEPHLPSVEGDREAVNTRRPLYFERRGNLNQWRERRPEIPFRVMWAQEIAELLPKRIRPLYDLLPDNERQEVMELLRWK